MCACVRVCLSVLCVSLIGSRSCAKVKVARVIA